MAGQDGIDPRHDPIFQRGYDPEVHGGPVEGTVSSPRRSRQRRDADLELYAPPSGRRSRDDDPDTIAAPATTRTQADPSRFARRPGPVTAAAADASEAEPDPFDVFRPSPSPQVEGADSVASVGRDRTASAPAAAPWRNPYLLGLVIGGAVLALAGFQMFRAALETIYVDFGQSGFIYEGGDTGSEDDPDPTGDLVSMQLGWSLGPLLLVIGLAAILSVVIFIAVRWRPAPTAPDAARDTSTEPEAES